METGFTLKKQPALPLRVYLCFDKLCFALKKKRRGITGKEKINVSLFTDHKVVYIYN